MSTADIPAVVVEPAGAARCTVIWLHGLGADGHDFEPVAPYLGIDAARGVRFVFPHAPMRPVTINGGMIMRAWYDIRSLTLRKDIDEAGVRESVDLVRRLIATENGRGVPAASIVLAGFSQGGAIALRAGLGHGERLAGIVALSTYLIGAGPAGTEVSMANRGLPVFLAHGSDDPLVPASLGEEAREKLRQLGCEVEWRSYPVGHEVHPLEIRDVGDAIGRMLRPGNAPP